VSGCFDRVPRSSAARAGLFYNLAAMPWSLKRFQQTGDLHFITFSCYRRLPLLGEPEHRDLLEWAVEQARVRYGFYLCGYVVMPEHVHLLVSEPEGKPLATAVQAIKQSVSRRLIGGRAHFWLERYYDFNVFSESKRKEKLAYMHHNPVARGLCAEPGEWQWSSFRHYATGERGVIEIESGWTARGRGAVELRRKPAP
jgi:putative transposase